MILVGVLLAAVEQDADTGGAQARTVLEMAVSVFMRRTGALMSADATGSGDRNVLLK
jgi:hypothetical protein